MNNIFLERLLVGDNAFYKINKTRGNKEVFYDKRNNNLIVFDAHSSFAEQVMKYTHPVAFRYLTKKLSKRRNYAVYWSQPFQFAASGWIIFRSQDVEQLKQMPHERIIKVLNESIIEIDDSFDSKFSFVTKEGILKPAKIKASADRLIC